MQDKLLFIPMLLLLGLASAVAKDIEFSVRTLDDHRAELVWNGSARSWTIERQDTGVFATTAMLDSSTYKWVDTTLQIGRTYRYRLTAKLADNRIEQFTDSARVHLDAPGIAGVVALTENTALVWWDSVDANAKEIQLLVSDNTWDKPTPKKKAESKKGWMIAENLQSRRSYRLSLVALTSHNASDACDEYNYKHIAPSFDWAFVPGDSFRMGASQAEESPQHEVHLSSYLLACAEITNHNYLVYCNGDSVPCPEPPDFPEIRDYVHHRPDFPVVNVNWYDAVNYCNWLSASMSLPCAFDSSYQLKHFDGVRLPTEAEWEHAASLSGGKYPWGNSAPGVELANYAAQHNGPKAVKSYPPTQGGFYDLAGNVWEWCLDWYGSYRNERRDPRGEDVGLYRVVRGGSWADPESLLTSTNRGKLSPETSLSTVGFRVARTIDVPPVKVIRPNDVRGESILEK